MLPAKNSSSISSIIKAELEDAIQKKKVQFSKIILLNFLKIVYQKKGNLFFLVEDPKKLKDSYSQK